MEFHAHVHVFSGYPTPPEADPYIILPTEKKNYATLSHALVQVIDPNRHLSRLPRLIRSKQESYTAESEECALLMCTGAKNLKQLSDCENGSRQYTNK